jgi:hypothetical protein
MAGSCMLRHFTKYRSLIALTRCKSELLSSVTSKRVFRFSLVRLVSNSGLHFPTFLFLRQITNRRGLLLY